MINNSQCFYCSLLCGKAGLLAAIVEVTGGSIPGGIVLPVTKVVELTVFFVLTPFVWPVAINVQSDICAGDVNIPSRKPNKAKSNINFVYEWYIQWPQFNDVNNQGSTFNVKLKPHK